MADETTHYHEFLKLINVDQSDISSHILEKYEDFAAFYKRQNNLTVEHAFHKWCSMKVIEQPTTSIKELISPIKSNLVSWTEDFGLPDIILGAPSPTTTSSYMHTTMNSPLTLPPLPPPPTTTVITTTNIKTYRT